MEHPGAAARRGGRAESFVPVVGQIDAGRLTEGPDYATYRSRGTDDWLLLHTLGGRGRVATAAGGVEPEAGEAVLLRPRTLHDYGTAPGSAGWDLAFAHFHPRPEWLPLLEWPQPLGPGSGLGVVRAEGETHRRITGALGRASRAGGGALPRAVFFAMNALEEALLWCDTQNPLAGRTDERVLRVVEFVDAHLAEPLDARRLAEVAHLSPSRLGRLFAEHLGTSPQRYVERQRMVRAQRLLDLTRRPVGSIAARVGYADPLYFSQRFRRFTGVSPHAYRRRQAGAAG